MASDEETHGLFQKAMKGQWEKVLEAYRSGIKAQVARSKETALHIAIADGQTEIILSTADDSDASTAVLSRANDRGNTLLHLAARDGNVRVCHSIADKAASLVSLQNVEGKTSLFLAGLNGLAFQIIRLYPDLVNSIKSRWLFSPAYSS